MIVPRCAADVVPSLPNGNIHAGSVNPGGVVERDVGLGAVFPERCVTFCLVCVTELSKEREFSN